MLVVVTGGRRDIGFPVPIEITCYCAGDAAIMRVPRAAIEVRAIGRKTYAPLVARHITRQVGEAVSVEITRYTSLNAAVVTIPSRVVEVLGGGLGVSEIFPGKAVACSTLAPT